MKLLLFIDSLGSGGAQRQLATLAVAFKRRGHDVRFLVYHPHDHFLPLLQAAGVACQAIPPCSHWRRALAVRRILRQGWQDAVLSFLKAPCFYAELARLPAQRWALVAGEQLADYQMRRGNGRWLRNFHRRADVVVTNSHTNRLMLERAFPFLTTKLATLYNLVDLQLFQAVPDCRSQLSDGAAVRIVVAASYQEKKNMLGVAKALVHLRKESNAPHVVVDWFGDMPKGATPKREAQQFILSNGLSGILNLHAASKAIEKEYASASAVGLFSMVEGLPNVICEGMASGKPILLSRVCDAGALVKDGKNGFLCDPADPASIAAAIRRFAESSVESRALMGLESRRVAEELFAPETICSRYEAMFTTSSQQRVIAKLNCPREVPESAIETAEAWWCESK